MLRTEAIRTVLEAAIAVDLRRLIVLELRRRGLLEQIASSADDEDEMRMRADLAMVEAITIAERAPRDRVIDSLDDDEIRWIIEGAVARIRSG